MSKAQVPLVDEVAEAKAARDAAIKHYNEVLSTHRAAALTSVKATITEYGFTAKELGLEVAAKKETQPKNGDKAIAGTVYVNPADPSITWTGGGKGQRPRWLKDLLEAGKSYADLAKK